MLLITFGQPTPVEQKEDSTMLTSRATRTRLLDLLHTSTRILFTLIGSLGAMQLLAELQILALQTVIVSIALTTLLNVGGVWTIQFVLQNQLPAKTVFKTQSIALLDNVLDFLIVIPALTEVVHGASIQCLAFLQRTI